MRVGYFAYSVLLPDNTRCRVDLRGFFKGFAEWHAPNFKAKIRRGGDTVYLMPVAENVYYLLQTRDGELIKDVDRMLLGVKDIQSALASGHSIGVASFVYVADCFLGIGCRSLSPRIQALSALVHWVWTVFGWNYQFDLGALTRQVTKAEVRKLVDVREAYVEVDRRHSLMETVREYLGEDVDQQAVGLGRIEVRLRPLPRSQESIRESTIRLADAVCDEEGVSRFKIRGRFELADRLADLYLIGKGQIADQLDSSDETELITSMVKAAESNGLLQEVLHGYWQDRKHTTDHPDDFRGICNADHWIRRDDFTPG